MSPFTQAICDEILEPNIDVDELFTEYAEMCIPNIKFKSLPVLMSFSNRIVLHKQLSYTNFDEEVYKFVKKICWRLQQ